MSVRIKNEQKINFKNFSAIERRVKRAKKIEISYGFFSEQKHPDSGVSLAWIAYINEWGASRMGIPPRHMMDTVFRYAMVEFKDRFAKRYNDLIIHGGRIDPFIKEVGQTYTYAIKYTIEQKNMIKPANSPVTVRMKGKDAPMWDTGYLKDHAKFKIKKR